MSKISFELSKNLIAAQTDANISPSDDSSGYADTTVYLWIDGAEVFKHDVTDSGGYLEYTQDFSVGDHTIEIRSKDGDPTDVHIDKMFIDDKLCMPTQYDVKNVIYGNQSPLKFLMTDPYAKINNENYVWWGEVYSSEHVENSTFYRPRLVSDLGFNWRWYFTVKENGLVYWNFVGNPKDEYYDSTQEKMYYMAEVTPDLQIHTIRQQLEDDYVDLFFQSGISHTDDSTKATMRFAYGGDHPDAPFGSLWHVLQNDSSTLEWNQRGVPVDLGAWQGPGRYDENLYKLDDSLQEQDNNTDIVLKTFREYAKRVTNKWYIQSYGVTPITVTTS